MDERERVGRQVDACCCGNQLVILTGKCVCVFCVCERESARDSACEQRPADSCVPSAC